MKAFLVVLVLLVAGVVGLGFYRGWFSFASDSADAKSNITLTVDKDKMQADEKKVVANVQDVGHHVKDKAAATAEKSMDGTVVSVSSDDLTMTTTAGKDESHTLAADLKVTCDGKVCQAADLKPGMRIRVTTGSADPHAVTRIEALDKNAAFEKAG
ncbi:MAG: hypothetical protein ACRELG_20365 [Gemmataceae bacterium]